MDKKPKLRLVVNNTKKTDPKEIKDAVDEKLASSFKLGVKFRINGHEYASSDEIPTDVKKVLENVGILRDEKPSALKRVFGNKATEPGKNGFLRWFLITAVLVGAAALIKFLIK